MTDIILDIQDVSQTVEVDDPKLVKSFGQQLREAAGDSYKQEIQPNGDVKITLVIPGVKHG